MPNTEDERYQQLQLEEAEELKKRRQEAINYILTYVNKARVEAEVMRLKEFFAPLDTGRPAEKKTDRKKEESAAERLAEARRTSLTKSMKTAQSQLAQIIDSAPEEGSVNTDDLDRYLKEFAEAPTAFQAALAAMQIMPIADALENDRRLGKPLPYSSNQLRIADQAAFMGELINRGIIAIEILSETALNSDKLANSEDNLDDFQAIVMMNIVNDLRKQLYAEFRGQVIENSTENSPVSSEKKVDREGDGPSEEKTDDLIKEPQAPAKSLYPYFS